MGLLDKKSIKIDGIADFEWCPLSDRDQEDETKSGKKANRENVIAYWDPEIANQPARVSLMAIPSRSILRSKNQFNVSDVSASPFAMLALFRIFCLLSSVSCTGKIKAIFYASR